MQTVPVLGWAVVCLLALSAGLQAQEIGNAEIGYQGYYMANQGQSLRDTSGATFRFRRYVPGLGLLSGSFEGYRREGGFRTGDNFIELKSVPRIGWGWTITGGDYRFSPSLVEMPMPNLPLPEINATGIKVEGVRGRTAFSVFLGDQTLLDGPRINLRVRAPQWHFGAAYRRKIGARLQIGARYLRLNSSMAEIEKQTIFFPENRAFRSADILTFQASFALAKGLQIFGESSAGRGDRAYIDDAPPARFSAAAGLAYDSKIIAARANFVRQTNLYVPVLGYFLGDRKGPYGELRILPFGGFELSGSMSRYTNNLENDPRVSTFKSDSVSAGANLMLPWKLTWNAQFTNVRFSSAVEAIGQSVSSQNRQTLASLTRPFGSHNVRVAYREISVRSSNNPQTQKSAEVEDFFQMGRFLLSSSVRGQESRGAETRRSISCRGGIQARVGLVTAFAHVDLGNDLANETVFATSTYRTTLFGVSGPLSRRWNIHAELFRNSLAMQLNPASIFVLSGSGTPVSSVLGGVNQWSLLIRLAKTFDWGISAAPVDLNRMAEDVYYGSVEGFVFEQGHDPRVGVPGVEVILDGARKMTTDETGHYRFAEVSEGSHKVAFAPAGLPADYDAATDQIVVVVRTNRTSRADLLAVRLTMVKGTVQAPQGAPVEAVVVCLLPGDRYTTPRADGEFAFYNIPEGNYRIVIDQSRLPENVLPVGETEVAVNLRSGVKTPAIEFRVQVEQKTKPIRQVLRVEFGDAVMIDRELKNDEPNDQKKQKN